MQKWIISYVSMSFGSLSEILGQRQYTNFPQHEMFVQHLPWKEMWQQQSPLPSSKLEMKTLMSPEFFQKLCSPGKSQTGSKTRKALSPCSRSTGSTPALKTPSIRIVVQGLGLTSLTILHPRSKSEFIGLIFVTFYKRQFFLKSFNKPSCLLKRNVFRKISFL